MTKRRFFLLALLVALLAFAAAGCGGDGDDEATGGDTAAEGDNGGGNEDVSGSITVLAVWTGAEGEAFQAVLDGFNEQYPNVNVSYQSAQDPATVLSTAVEGGNPPDVAALSSPGIMADFAGRGALQPIDFARETVEENFAPVWLELGTVEGEFYGLFFKGANKSTVWYNVEAFENAGVEPPEDWETFLSNAETLKASGTPAYSIGGSDGWTLTDLFENIYLRTAGPELYDQLTRHEIPWTHDSVKEALTEMGKVLQGNRIAGGTQSALQTDFPTSVTQVFQDPPKAAQVIEGDFVGGVISGETEAEAGSGFDVYAFPEIGDSGPVVMGGGDVMVMFKDTPAGRALIEYLASPEAAEIWAERGGFSSPNRNLDADVYPDEITQQTAGALGEAEVFRFDLSDLQPAAFGGTVGQGLFALFQDFVRNPDNMQQIQQQMEQQA
ncbi:MAG TPA: extracellular solute-binding protein, partial [Gaiellaceae bacterium]|nr:extracellular solute-binding protein [Gaiellaceae bacterium]